MDRSLKKTLFLNQEQVEWLEETLADDICDKFDMENKENPLVQIYDKLVETKYVSMLNKLEIPAITDLLYVEIRRQGLAETSKNPLVTAYHKLKAM